MATVTEAKTSLPLEHEVLPYAPKFVLQTLPASLPECRFQPDLDFEAIATPIVDRLTRLTIQDFSAQPIWRDTFALTGSLRTFYSSQSILNAWSSTSALRQPESFTIVPASAKNVKLGGDVGWVEVAFEFHLAAPPAARCMGFLSLVPEDGEWKIWVLRTVLEQLDGGGDVDFLPSKFVTASGNSQANVGVAQPGQVNGDSEPGADGSVLDCVIIGGGQAGLSCGGRLQALGLNYIILDKNQRIGDCWAKRYDSAKLHTIREYNHLPFNHTFPDTCNEFLTKDELAAGYEHWAREFGVDEHIWLDTTIESGTWDSAKELWTLRTRTSSTPKILTARTVIMATGPGGQIPKMPSLPNQSQFRGTILHSVDYRSAFQWKGKAGIVVGTANTAHDVAADMVAAGLSSTTMVQRTRTHVLPWEYFAAIVRPSYHKDADLVAADRAGSTMPVAVTRLMAKRGMDGMARQEPERFEALERAGFRCERYGEIFWHILERLGGHYIDVGCSKLIADGLIKMISGRTIASFTPHGVIFSEGTEVPADVVVFCTGFIGDMRSDIERIFGPAIADEVGDFWGLNEEGEIKGAYKPSRHPGMWCIGGTIPGSRYYSRHVALQIKAVVEGVPLPVYEGERYVDSASS